MDFEKRFDGKFFSKVNLAKKSEYKIFYLFIWDLIFEMEAVIVL